MASNEQPQPTARDTAMAAAVYALTGIAVQVAVIIAVTKRDWLARQLARYRWHVLREWRGSLERRLVAELRRDLSRMDHEGIPHGD